VLGSYRIINEIGRGGMGAVYLAEHPILGRRAAVKVLLDEYSRNEDLLARFFNEARAAARLEHRAFVDVFDCGTVDGNAFIIMEFIRGESLGARLDRAGPLPVETALEVGRKIAEAMAVAHAHGIVHRDLKPDNLMLLPPGAGESGHEVKILDFGIAKLTTASEDQVRRTRTGVVMGTPLYMSPEQCRGAGAGIDHRTDIYSLGGILYALLTGGPPFGFGYSGELIAAHLGTPPPPLRPLNPAVSPALEALVLRTLAKEPGARPQTMQELAQELARLEREPRPVPGTMAATQVLPGEGATQVLPGEAAPAIPKTQVLPGASPAASQGGRTTLSRTASELLGTTQPPAGRRRGVQVAIAAGLVTAAVVAAMVLRVGPPAGRANGPVSASPAPVPVPGVAPPIPAPPPAAPGPGEGARTPAAPPESAGPAPGRTPGQTPRGPAAARSVAIKLRSNPSGARILDLDKNAVLGTTPFGGRFARSKGRLRLRLERAGYAPAVVEVPLSEDGARDVVLQAEVNPAVDTQEARKL
jgi:serine/threonine-protein kinase